MKTQSEGKFNAEIRTRKNDGMKQSQGQLFGAVEVDETCIGVAVGILPAVEPGRPAWRIKALESTNRAGTFQNRTHLPSFFPGGGTPALPGRRDVRRYHASGAAFPKADQTVPMLIGTAIATFGRLIAHF